MRGKETRRTLYVLPSGIPAGVTHCFSHLNTLYTAITNNQNNAKPPRSSLVRRRYIRYRVSTKPKSVLFIKAR